MPGLHELELAIILAQAQATTRAVAEQRSAAIEFHRKRITEVAGARQDWLNAQKTRTPTTAEQLEKIYRSAQLHEVAADNIRKQFEDRYSKVLQDEQDALKNLTDWRNFGIAIVDQEKARKEEMQRKQEQRMQDAAELEARKRAADLEATKKRLDRERQDRLERERAKRAERERKAEERREQQKAEEQHRYYQWKSQNAHKPFSQGGANLTTDTSSAFTAACTTWRAAVEVAFNDYASIKDFPQPPVSGTCVKASCKAEKRALRACACDVQKALRAGRVELKRERNGWHPDKFSGCDEERREEWQRMAKEMFQVVSVMYQGQGRG
ncbi:hypothetical protein CLAFUW4_11409 [Fulvia fulva]|uniref:uncharacterized protein n=1 Tax=Passalora fulva TaxID=5499 RepID=UPI002852DB3C|nr:uncharacterized protein CLAFUR5_20312 [Fulvia fulva]KAK4619895.1 hypothetical protein CLAFUR4_11415 [Fulvia fulva]KAK4620558.1 hypothetical protein CLAFUR0_11421 [Fulvia fulva]WMI38960.1 hypothetical protein CLAFUR5_20312 [Fulvia fulva]WPV17184.1 hypothetical protein CLAFUW4_11409 [Fulvia fulva]WPV32466.1 hypothetical protein CLAFUW7_11405 [Fulvia fulva]